MTTFTVSFGSDFMQYKEVVKRLSKALCINCRYLNTIYKSKRVNYWCEHPDQRSIIKYFEEHRLNKHPSYIGDKKIGEVNFCVQNTPKWCPRMSNGGSSNEN